MDERLGKKRIIDYLKTHGCGIGFSKGDFTYLLHHSKEREYVPPPTARKDNREHYSVAKYNRGESFIPVGKALENLSFMPDEFELWLDLLLDDTIYLFTYRING